MNPLQSQLYNHSPSPCPTCSDPSLRPAVREEQQASPGHFRVGHRVRTTNAHRRLNGEDAEFYGHPGTIILDQEFDPMPLIRIRWDAFEYRGHTIPAREGLAHPGNLEHVEPVR